MRKRGTRSEYCIDTQGHRVGNTLDDTSQHRLAAGIQTQAKPRTPQCGIDEGRAFPRNVRDEKRIGCLHSLVERRIRLVNGGVKPRESLTQGEAGILHRTDPVPPRPRCPRCREQVCSVTDTARGLGYE